MRSRLNVQWKRFAVFAPVAVLFLVVAQAHAGLSPELQKCSNILNQVICETVQIRVAMEKSDKAAHELHTRLLQDHVMELVTLCFKDPKPVTFVGEGIVRGGSPNGLMFGGECDPEREIHPASTYDYALEAAKEDGLRQCIAAGFAVDQCEFQHADDGVIIGSDPNEHSFGGASSRCRVRAYYQVRQ